MRRKAVAAIAASPHLTLAIGGPSTPGGPSPFWVRAR
jgi:hypothetical protein